MVFGDTDTKNVDVKLLNGLAQRSGSLLVGEDSERGNDFAELPVVFNFDKRKILAGIHIGKIFVAKSGNFLCEEVIGEVDDFGRVNLNLALFRGRRVDGNIRLELILAEGSGITEGVSSGGGRGRLITAAHPVRVINARELHDAFSLVKITSVVCASVGSE